MGQRPHELRVIIGCRIEKPLGVPKIVESHVDRDVARSGNSIGIDDRIGCKSASRCIVGVHGNRQLNVECSPLVARHHSIPFRDGGVHHPSRYGCTGTEGRVKLIAGVTSIGPDDG